VVVKKGDITRESTQAIVNPANSYGFMGGGLALSIKETGGDSIEKEAVSKAPIPLGKAVITNAGSLKAEYIIHSPTMKNPSERIGLENIRLSVKAALNCAVENNITKIAFPGMGTGVGGVDKDKAVMVMVEEIKSFTDKNNSIEEIDFIGYDKELYGFFVKWSKTLSLETK